MISVFLPCFAVKTVERQTSEHTHHTKPLTRDQRVSKQQHGSKNGEELPSGGNDRTGERTKVCHGHEDEILKQNNIKSVKKAVSCILAPLVQRVDNAFQRSAIQRIKCTPINTFYLLDSDLSTGKSYPPFEQTGPDFYSKFGKYLNACRSQIYEALQIEDDWHRFPAFSSTYTLTDQYYHSLSVDTTIMISNTCLVIGEQVVVISST